MNRAKRLMMVLVLGGGALTVGGCGPRYYQVMDPQTGSTFYTQNVETLSPSGAVRIKDGATGATVTMQNSTVNQISREQYDQGLREAAAKKVMPPK